MKNVPPGLGNKAKRYRKTSEALVGSGINKIRKSKRVKRKNERKRNKPKVKKN